MHWPLANGRSLRYSYCCYWYDWKKGEKKAKGARSGVKRIKAAIAAVVDALISLGATNSERIKWN